MTLTVKYVLKSLDGAWGIAARDADALKNFDLSARGFWNSFAAAALAAPFWLWFSLSQQAYLADLAAASSREYIQPPLGIFLIAEGFAYIFGWILFPLMIIPITKILQVKQKYATYIIVHNWSMVLVYFLLAMPPVALFNLGLISIETKGFLDLTTLFLELAYMWVIARTVLEISIASALAIVVLDVLLSILISLTAQIFYAL